MSRILLDYVDAVKFSTMVLLKIGSNNLYLMKFPPLISIRGSQVRLEDLVILEWIGFYWLVAITVTLSNTSVGRLLSSRRTWVSRSRSTTGQRKP